MHGKLVSTTQYADFIHRLEMGVPCPDYELLGF